MHAYVMADNSSIDRFHKLKCTMLRISTQKLHVYKKRKNSNCGTPKQQHCTHTTHGCTQKYTISHKPLSWRARPSTPTEWPSLRQPPSSSVPPAAPPSAQLPSPSGSGPFAAACARRTGWSSLPEPCAVLQRRLARGACGTRSGCEGRRALGGRQQWLHGPAYHANGPAAQRSAPPIGLLFAATCVKCMTSKTQY